MQMKEIKITYENLFKLISEEEKIAFEFEKEHFQTTPIEILDEHNNWVSVKGLIQKEAETLEIELDALENIICADNHIIQDINGELRFAKDLNPGDKLNNAKGENYIITQMNSIGMKTVYDLEVDNETHLYQCAKGLVHHNTLLTSALVEYANRLNMRTITIVPSSSLLKQTHDYIKQFNIPVGMFGNGRKDDDPNIVATWQTLQNNKSFIKDFECIIWDECVHPSSMIRMADNSEKRIDCINAGDMVKTINESTHQIESKPVIKIHKNLLKSQNQKMFRITLENESVIELTGNHEVLTNNGWKRTDMLIMTDEIISLAEQFDYHLIELYLKKKFGKSIHEWFNLTPTTISRWKKIIPVKYITQFKEMTRLDTIDELIKEIY